MDTQDFSVAVRINHLAEASPLISYEAMHIPFVWMHRHHILTISVTGISVDIPAQFQGFTTALCD
jgi:hypothetical protein